MEIFFIIFAVSVPILYIWGLISAIRWISGGKSEKQEIDSITEKQFDDLKYTNRRLQDKIKSLEAELKHERLLSSEIMQRGSKYPEMSIASLIAELFPPEPPVDETAAALSDLISAAEDNPEMTRAASIAVESPKIVEELPARYSESKRAEKKLPEARYVEPKADTEPKRPVQYIAPQTAPKPAFDWANWFSDNAINLLLFVGAFLVVAAVSFFMWSQWGNIPNTVKFGFVLTFASAWYAAGMLFNRGESFKTVGITFITIGALLTPFVGVGFHQFILNGDVGSIGIVWLITSIFSTVVYTILSLVFQRRYFTYFGTLSILAMLLSLVQISNAEPAYFILAGSVTALILLVGRIGLRFFPYLNNYMGQDYEMSSIGTLMLSLAFGLGIVIFTGEPPFFSLDVFAVGAVTVVYLWVYCSLHHEEYYLLGAHLLTVLMAGHCAFSFTNEPMIALTAMFIAQFALQVILHQVYKSAKQLQDNAHHLSLVLGGLSYLASIVFPYESLHHFMSAGMAFTLMMQLSFYVRRFGQYPLYYGCVTLSFATLAHALLGANIELSYWGLAFVVLGLAETLGASFVKDDHLRRAQLGLSLFLMAASGFVGISTVSRPFENSENLIGFGTAFAALAGFAIISYIEEIRSYKLLPYPVHILSAFVGVGYYVFSYSLGNLLGTSALGLAAAGSFYMAYRHKHHAWLMSLTAIMLYPTLNSFLHFIDTGHSYWGIAYVGLAALQFGVAYLPFEKNLRQGVAYVGMIGLGLFSTGYLANYAGNGFAIGASFAALGIYAVVSGYELSREERFFVPLSHLAGIATAMATIMIANSMEQFTAFTVLGFSLALSGLLALFHLHIPHRFSMMALTASSHIALWYLLQTLGIGMALPWHLALSALQLGFAYLRFIHSDIRSAVATVGIWGMVVFVSIAAVLGHPAANQTALSLTMVWLGLGYLAFFEEAQRRLENPLVTGFSRQLPIISAAIAYGVSFSYTDAPFLTMAYGFGLLYFLLSNYRHSTNTVWLYASMTLLYPIILYGFWSGSVPHDFWLIGTAALGAVQILALYTPLFDENTRKGIMQIGIAGLSVSAFALLVPERVAVFPFMQGTDTLHLPAVLMSLAVFAVFGVLELRQTERRVDAMVFLMPVGLAVISYFIYAMPRLSITVFDFVRYSPFYSIAFALATSLSLAIAYRHDRNRLYLFAMTLAFYPALLHFLDFAGSPIQYYPPAIALLSMALYLSRKAIVGEEGAGAMTFILLGILGITGVSHHFNLVNTAEYQVYSWLAGYFFLLIFWHSRIVPQRQAREFMLAGAVYVQYLMHLSYAVRYTEYTALFSDLQWYSAALAFLLLILSVREAHFQENKLPMPLVYLAAAIALLPSYYQNVVHDNMGYAFLGIVYGLIIMGLGILYRNGRTSATGVLGIIIAVLIPMGTFILSQPWWVILLIVGLVLIVAAVALTTLRRNSKKKMLES